jgi:hypothetical protein
LNSFTASWYSSVSLGTLNRWHVFSWPFSIGCGCQCCGKTVGGKK